jgi:hypothetical protein
MDARPNAREAVSMAYAQPQVAKAIRRKSSPVPGWMYDATVVTLFVVFAAIYFAT